MDKYYHFPLWLLRCLLLLLIIHEAGGLAHGQILNKQRPSVYLSFKEYTRTNEGQEGIKMVLYNNTRWPIFVTRLMEPALKGQVPLSYIIEAKTGCRDERLAIDVIMSIKLMPGKGISFFVPNDDFPRESKIYVEFTFSWENRSDGKPHPDDPVHRAYFSSMDLPSFGKK